jgi:alkyl hydroperoxide reductase subunit AhpF
VRLAHQFAMENDQITADCVEATQFQELASMHGVYSVPRTVVNGKGFLEGSLPETHFLEGILKAADPDANPPN